MHLVARACSRHRHRRLPFAQLPSVSAKALCTASKRHAEPAESLDQPIPLTPRVILEDQTPPSKKGPIAGALCLTAAIPLWGWNHAEWATSVAMAYGVDAAAGALALAGIGTIAATLGRDRGGKSAATGKKKFKLVPFDVQRGLLTEPGDEPALTPAVEKLLKEAAEKEEGKAKKDRKAQLEAAIADVSKSLHDGVPAKRVRQRLLPKVYVIRFSTEESRAQVGTGVDLHARLREQVAQLLTIATPFDEVVLLLSSPGGAVGTYGLSSMELSRLVSAGVKLTVAIDTVAASGGYMMASVADHIVAAPFAMVGSIGVIATVPNVSKTLERGGVEVLQRTAGNYKRTVNVAVPNTAEGIAKFEEELETIHASFKEWVGARRPQLDLERVCTGEVWLAKNALALGLVDEVMTADAYVRSRSSDATVLVLESTKSKQSPLAVLAERLVSIKHKA